MANWHESIKVEVKLPYYTQNTMQLRYQAYEQTITSEDIWFGEERGIGLVWKAYIPIGEHNLLFFGKATILHGKEYKETTHKVNAAYSFDNVLTSYNRFKVKVISYK